VIARVRHAGLFALIVIALAASPRALPQTPAAAGYPALGEAAVVTLLAPGAEPRSRLRYAIPASYKGRMLMTTGISVSMTLGGTTLPAMPMPVMKMAADMSVTGVSASGDVSYNLAFAEMTVDAGPGVDAAASAAMQAAASGLSAVRGSATVSNRGVTRDLKIDLDQITNPALKQTMAQFSTSMQNTSMPLPEEAVGVGARWQVRQTTSANGILTYQNSVYEIVSVGGPAVALTLKVDQTAPAQAVSNPSLPPGAQMQLEDLTGTGTGTIQLRLDALIPTSEMSVSNTANMVATMGADTQRVNVQTTVKFTVAPAK
jgi:hypothetical protein